MSKADLFQTIQFSISTQFSAIWPVDRALSGATTPGQREPGSKGNEEVLLIPQSSSITGTLPSDCLVSYPGHSLGESYPSAEKQSVYSTALANWAKEAWLSHKLYIHICIFCVVVSQEVFFHTVQPNTNNC